MNVNLQCHPNIWPKLASARSANNCGTVIMFGRMVQQEESTDITETVHRFSSSDYSVCVYIYVSIIYLLF
jgi:hypothetical protein